MELERSEEGCDAEASCVCTHDLFKAGLAGFCSTTTTRSTSHHVYVVREYHFASGSVFQRKKKSEKAALRGRACLLTAFMQWLLRERSYAEREGGVWKLKCRR